jgi:uncharacterized protein (TIGR02611 family)
MTSGLHSPGDWLRWIGKNTKRIVVLFLGTAVLVAGVLMLVLPGPGIIVIILGFAILATEFAWAERALDRTTSKAASAASKVSDNKNGRLLLAVSGVAMLIGGAVVSATVSSLRVVGISVAIAGIISLSTLHPKVQRWISEKSSKPML